VSFGVFELTVGRTELPAPDDVCAAVVRAGYEGIDLGPPGYLGRGSDLVGRLARWGLGLAGGWVQLRFSEPDGLAQDLEDLEDALGAFEAAAELDPRLPKPTLADAGSKARRAHPGRGGEMPEIGLDTQGWRRLGRGVGAAVERCRARGLEPTFHHHAGTHVEAPHEIDRLLELTDVGLCLDTGHLLLAGADPLRALERWGERINHLHLKDVRLEVLETVTAEGGGLEAVWARGAFCRLGDGDLDVEGWLEAVRGAAYRGWLVVEQDRIAAPGEPLSASARAQAANREFLRGRGL
jgi:inosose dehydratase